MTTKRYFQGKTKREKAQPKRLKETRTFHQPSEPSVWGHPHTNLGGGGTRTEVSAARARLACVGILCFATHHNQCNEIVGIISDYSEEADVQRGPAICLRPHST